jgi:hypothetical protein
VRHDPPRIVWSGVCWRDVRPAADLQRKESEVEELRDPRFWLSLALTPLVMFAVLAGVAVLATAWR